MGCMPLYRRAKLWYSHENMGSLLPFLQAVQKWTQLNRNTPDPERHSSLLQGYHQNDNLRNLRNIRNLLDDLWNQPVLLLSTEHLRRLK